jgi:hypothetical protein
MTQKPLLKFLYKATTNLMATGFSFSISPIEKD